MNTTSAERQILNIELLALDLTSCGRCTGTEQNLEDALETVSAMLRAADVEANVEKHVVTTAEQAERLRMIASPTVRVNGGDIAFDLRESNCGDCGDSCGCGGEVDCRVWVWKGEEYLEAPKAMIVDAVLRAYAAGHSLHPTGEYRLPENLRRFFAAKQQDTEARIKDELKDESHPRRAAASACCKPQASATKRGCC